MSNDSSFTVTMAVEKETKNAVRFQEVTESSVAPVFIGTLYVQKASFAAHGAIPQSIEVTVKPL